MTVAINQDALDYSNDAQFRVAADTRYLRDKQDIDVEAGQQVYDIPSDVIQILAVYNDKTSIPPIILDDALEIISGSISTSQLVCYTLETQKLGFLPTPTEDFTATLYYIARPEPLNSGEEFTFEGSFETLIEHLALASRLDDDGQPELATYELQFYQAEVQKLHKQRVSEQRQRLATIAYGQL